MSLMTPTEQSARSLELRLSQQRRRDRKRALGLCAACGVRTPDKGYKTCSECITASVNSPSVLVQRTAKALIREGRRITINAISKELDFNPLYVKEVLIGKNLYQDKSKKSHK